MTNSIIIFNSSSKIRPIWRLILFLLITFAINIPLQMGLQKALSQSLLRGVISGSIYFISVILSLLIQVKFLDKSSFRKYGLEINKAWIYDFIVGSLIALIQLLLFFIIMYLTDNLKIVGYFVTSSPNYSFLEGFLSETFGLFVGGFIEELFFRAFLFYVLYEALNAIIKDPRERAIFMIVVISPLFGLAHLGNNGATIISTINLGFDAIMMCLPFLITGRLGMSIGIHFSWNLIQGSVFGFAMSGNTAKASIMSVSMPNNFFTGGIFGPEGSVLLFALDLIAVLLILYWKKLRNYKDIVSPDIIKNSNN
jgi:membrane protease YdiL (CAAX protease family)